MTDGRVRQWFRSFKHYHTNVYDKEWSSKLSTKDDEIFVQAEKCKMNGDWLLVAGWQNSAFWTHLWLHNCNRKARISQIVYKVCSNNVHQHKEQIMCSRWEFRCFHSPHCYGQRNMNVQHLRKTETRVTAVTAFTFSKTGIFSISILDLKNNGYHFFETNKTSFTLTRLRRSMQNRGSDKMLSSLILLYDKA